MTSAKFSYIPEEVGNALSTSRFFIFCITMADPNVHDVTNNVYEYSYASWTNLSCHAIFFLKKKTLIGRALQGLLDDCYLFTIF